MLKYSRSLVFSLTLLPSMAGLAQDAQPAAPAQPIQRVELSQSGDSLMPRNTNERFDAELKIGMGYQTNAYSLPSASKKDSGNWTLRIKPNLSFVGDGKLARLELGGNAFLDLVFGSAEDTQLVLDGKVFGQGEINPHGSASMMAYQSIEVDTHAEELYVGALSQLTSDTKLGASIRPVDGDVTISANVESVNKSYLDISLPPQGATATPTDLGNEHYSVNGRLSWDAMQDMSIYAEANYGVWYGNVERLLTSSNPFGVRAGIGGEITPGLHADFNAGYARVFTRLLLTDTLLDSASLSFSTSADLNWKISDESNLSFHIGRNVKPSSVFLESWKNNVAVDFRQKFAEKFTLLLAPSLSWYEKGKPLSPSGTPLAGKQRNDIVLGDLEELQYYPNDWLSFGVLHQGKYRWTNAGSFSSTSGKIAQASGNFDQTITNDLFLVFVGMYY